MEANEALVRNATLEQRNAADPAHSRWVSANAGSGKTKVLIDRVARILLMRSIDAHGRQIESDPSRILCLTYTRAAAAEMQNRLFRQLGQWALMTDEALTEDLLQLTGKTALEEDALPRARRLFAAALETPGGLKIQTIHAFCESLLHRFPLEARIQPHFTLLDEQGQLELAREAADTALGRLAQTDPEAAEQIIRGSSEDGFHSLTMNIIQERNLYEDKKARSLIPKALDLDAGDNEKAVYSEFETIVTPKTIKELYQALSSTEEPSMVQATERLLPALSTPLAEEKFQALFACLVTKKGTPRQKHPTKKIEEELFPGTRAIVESLQAHLLAWQERLIALNARNRSLALYDFATLFLADYEARKEALGVLDFQDLIRHTVSLLSTATSAQWVLYKLDGGIDHILVDEAQDTSPDQWAVIKALAGEFFAGEGRHQGPARTVFAVGDEKQSIYSFQGADPEGFAGAQNHFHRLAEGVGVDVRPIPLLTSFRSTPQVLGFTDAVFADEAAAKGVSFQGARIEHLATRSTAAGSVELWPLLPKPPKEEHPHWWIALTPQTAEATAKPAFRQLAETLAGRISEMIGKLDLPTERRKVRAGDILILVKNRAPFAREMIRQLKTRNIPVAGVDRMVLREELVVRDLMALARVALLPEDDLTLAALLRSPLLGLSEEELFTLAHKRKSSLWQALRQAREKEPYREAFSILADCISRADYLRPFEFFERILVRHQGRAKLLGRLGHQIEDPLEELLTSALTFEAAHTPSLQAFIGWMDAGAPEIKRESERTPDKVRLMTVHGAKGLEANVVILPDTVSLPSMTKAPKIFALKDAPLWSTRKEENPPALLEAGEAWMARQLEEYRRLFYVAATRARDHLLICGWGDESMKNYAHTWHGMAKRAFEALPFDAVPTPFPGEDGEDCKLGWRLAGTAVATSTEKPEKDSHIQHPAPPLPGWVSEKPPKEAGIIPALAPSRLSEGMDPARPEGSATPHASLDPETAMARGILLHQLIEHLAGTTPDEQPGIAAEFAALHARTLPPEHRESAIKAALECLQNPNLAWIFSEGLSEVPMHGPLHALGGRAINGAIDRLIYRNGRFDLIEYKSGSPKEPVPEGYLRQVAVYRAALMECYPEAEMQTHLLWTDAQSLVTLEPNALDAALARAAEFAAFHPPFEPDATADHTAVITTSLDVQGEDT